MSTTPATGSRWRRLTVGKSPWIPALAALGILVVMLVAGQAYFGTFVSPRLLSSLLLDNAYLIIIAVGMTFVILTGGIDLSVGSVMGFTGILGARMLLDGWPVGVVIPVMILCGSAIGAIIGVMVQFFDVQPFIASLAGMFLGRGLAYMIGLDSKALPVNDPLVLGLQSLRLGGGGWYITPTGIIAILTLIAGACILVFTRFGRTVYGIGGSEQSARLMGLPVIRTKLLVYIVSGTCAGLAGLVFTAYTGAGYSLNGVGTELDAIAAVVIGGTLLTGGSGYALGSFIGVLVYGLIKVIISFMGADQAWTRIIVGALLLAFIVVQRLIVARTRRR